MPEPAMPPKTAARHLKPAPANTRETALRPLFWTGKLASLESLAAAAAAPCMLKNFSSKHCFSPPD
jgi:hypothetical protein